MRNWRKSSNFVDVMTETVGKHKRWTVAVCLTALLAVGAALLLLEKNLLWKVQELNLFLPTGTFFRQQLVVPGGVLTWLSTWFTQFFFRPWLGVLMLLAWWGLLMELTRRTFRLSLRWPVLLLVPVALLLVTDVDLGYWVYILKLRGHFFFTTIGITVVVALLWAWRSVPRRWGLQQAFLVLTAILGYPLLGAYGLLATLLMALWAWRLDSRTQAVVSTVLAVLLVIAVPQFCYRLVFYQVNQSDVYWAGLPLYQLEDIYHRYYIPYYLLAVYLAALCLLGKNPSGGERKQPSHSFLAKSVVWQTVLGAVLVVGVAASWYRDENFHHELAMQRCIDRQDWQGVVDEAVRQHDEPTRAIVVMRNLALARLGRQANEMYRYRNGSKRSNAPFPMRMLVSVGPLVYFHYGLPNFSTRLSMELGVEYGWRAEYLKNMARCALVNGEEQVARKYIGLLKQTAFHRPWAEHAEKLLLHPELAADDPELGPAARMMHYDEQLANDQGYVEPFVMRCLAGSTYARDPFFQEQALLASMETRDTKMFWKHFVNYVRLHPTDQLPVHVQEAALLFASLEGRKDVDSWPFDNAVRESYRRFREATPRYENMEVDAVRDALYPQFGQTYFYDYYLMSNLPHY